MGTLRIHCGSCHRRWVIYWRDNWKAVAARTCPHCGAVVDDQLWTKQIIPAFGCVIDANEELEKDHTGYGSPLFRIAVI